MMRIPPINLDPVMLAARVANALNQSHRLAFAQLAPDLTLVQHSPNFLVLLEKPEWHVVGQPIVELLGEFVGAEAMLQLVLQGDLPAYNLEFVNRIQEDESVVYLNFQVTALDEHQPGRGLLMIVEDVTEFGRLQQTLTQDRNELLLLQKQLAQTNEDLHRSNQLKSLFLSMAAHDLRSPLSIINGYAELLQRLFLKDETSENIPRYILNIETQSKRMNRLVNDLLDLDLIERGELRLNLKVYDLVKLVQDVAEAEKLNFSNREIEIRLPYLPINLMLDSEKISRILHNLINNAYKYTPESGHITILAAHTEDEAIFQIMDNGQGMNPEQIENLFQPYYRTEDAQSSKIEGRGLGLYIVKMLVEAHYGRIEVESVLGKGSTFTVYLPLDASLENEKN